MEETKRVTLSKIGVVMLGVSDVARSLLFYRDRLGLPVRGTGGEFAFLDAGGVTLSLRGTSNLKGPGDERRVEVVFSVDDIQAAYDSLRIARSRIPA